MPWSKVLGFTDPYPYQAAIRAADVEIIPTAIGEFRVELTQIAMNQLWMQRSHQSLPAISTGAVNRSRRAIGFLADHASPSMQHCGIEVAYGDIIVNGSDAMRQRFAANSHYAAMSLTHEQLDAAFETLVGHPYSEAADWHLIRPDSASFSRLHRLHGMVKLITKATPDFLEIPEVVRALEDKLVHAMVGCLFDSTLLRKTEGERRHDMIVARFEAFLEANPSKPVYLTEICAGIGVAERTLRTACEQHLGMAPIRYLTLRRMHLVRRALQTTDASKATVTRIATDHGFWELGRFAGAYRTIFGESPSVTLHRPPEDLRIFQNRPSSLDRQVLHS